MWLLSNKFRCANSRNCSWSSLENQLEGFKPLRQCLGRNSRFWNWSKLGTEFSGSRVNHFRSKLTTSASSNQRTRAISAITKKISRIRQILDSAVRVDWTAKGAGADQILRNHTKKDRQKQESTGATVRRGLIRGGVMGVHQSSVACRNSTVLANLTV